MSTTPADPLSCPRCGALIPTHTTARVVDGRPLKDCRRCGKAVDLLEVVG
jgi:hypothetical protein